MFERLSPPDVRVEDLAGTWHIVRTNFPMWLRGDKRRPCLEYGILDRDRGTLSDLVTFEKGGRAKSIRGVDRQDPARSCHFTWRGRGLLKLLRSDWYVIDLDRKRGLAAIYFTKTLFTPEGLDVVSRAAIPDLHVAAFDDLEREIDAFVRDVAADDRGDDDGTEDTK